MDGVANALLGEVRLAQCHPLHRKFGVCGQQRHKIGGKRRAPPLGFGADDLFHRDLDNTHVHMAGGHAAV